MPSLAKPDTSLFLPSWLLLLLLHLLPLLLHGSMMSSWNLILHGCPELHKLPERLGDLMCLEVLDFGRGVANEQLPASPLRPRQLLSSSWKDPSPVALTLPSLSTLCSLRDLNLSYCKLRDGAIPDDLGCLHLLKNLDLRGNDFESLPTSIGQLSKVQKIFLEGCESLKSLPNLPSSVQYLFCLGCKSLKITSESICRLSNLLELDLTNCSSVESLPDLPTSIELLWMDGCAALATLPSNFSGLSQLNELYLGDCESLQTLPDLPSSIVYLTMKSCSSLEATPDVSESLNSTEVYFSFQNCLKLTEKQDLFGCLKKYLHPILKNKSQGLPKFRVWMSATGGEIPRWFNYLSDGGSLKMKLPPYWFNNECLGFSIFAVFGRNDSVGKAEHSFIVKVGARTTEIYVVLHQAYEQLQVDTCLMSDVVFLNIIPFDKSRGADWWNSLRRLIVSITDDSRALKLKYVGFRIVYEKDVEELSGWGGTSSSAPFHNVVSTNKRSHDDDGCSTDSQVETRPSGKRLKAEGDEH